VIIWTGNIKKYLTFFKNHLICKNNNDREMKMSYSGTVYCGYCGVLGHNRLGCPSRKKKAEEGGYLAREIQREKQRREAAVSKRVCSYCKQPGHNRRKCSDMQDDKRTVLADTAFARKRVLNSMMENGIGIGALVRAYYNCDKRYPILHVIEDIRWDRIDDGVLYNQHNVWRSYARDVIHTRIASVASLKDYESNAWHRPPKVGGRSSLNMTHLASIIPSAVSPLLRGYSGNFSGEEYVHGLKLEDTPLIASVECWAQSVCPPDGWLEPLSLTGYQTLHWHFRFPDRGAAEWDKMRKAPQWTARDELKHNWEKK